MEPPAAAISPAHPAADAGPPPQLAMPWSRSLQVAFRYALCFWLLMSAPGFLVGMFEVLDAILKWSAETTTWEWLHEGPLLWPSGIVQAIGRLDSAVWQPLTSWLWQQHLVPYEVIHQPTGSGDTGHDLAMLMVFAFVTGLFTLAWSWLASGSTGYPRASRWLHVAVRFDVAFVMLSYGSAKLYDSQFGELGLSRLTMEVGDLRPMTMVGTFMQANPGYELFGGVGEVLGALLLFHRRTACLGALVTIAVMTNVCALNWLCGVPVKVYSARLLLYTIALLVPFRARLWALFVSNRVAPPVDLAFVQDRWARRLWTAFGTGLVLFVLFLTHVNRTGPKPWLVGTEKSSLYGVWKVERMVVDGVEVAETDVTRWRYLAIDRGKDAWVREVSGTRRGFEFVLDEGKLEAQVKERRDGKLGDADAWTIVRGSKIGPVDVPLLLRNEDRAQQRIGPRPSLTVKGTWRGKPFELEVVAKRFRLQTGFRLRQELPDFW
ncbi:MAG: hypothetical protein IPK26_21605 [Planctomycetes bacterium]|nr:hypothetical protein [Planctomycetota bacterium]